MGIRSLLALFTLATAAGALPRSAAAQTSYPIVCRGGPAMRLEVEVKAGSPGSVRLHFARGGRAAVLGVDPGTCAWQDRGMRAAEPAVLCFARPDHTGFTLAASRTISQLRVRAFAGTQPVIFWEGGERPDGAAVQLAATEHQYYRAYHDAGSGCLQATQVGP